MPEVVGPRLEEVRERGRRGARRAPSPRARRRLADLRSVASMVASRRWRAGGLSLSASRRVSRRWRAGTDPSSTRKGKTGTDAASEQRRRSTRRGAPPASRATPRPPSRTTAPPGRARRTRRPRTRSPAPPARPARASSTSPTSRSCRTACRSRAPRRGGSGPPRRPRGRGAALACVETPPLGRRRGASSVQKPGQPGPRTRWDVMLPRRPSVTLLRVTPARRRRGQLAAVRH